MNPLDADNDFTQGQTTRERTRNVALELLRSGEFPSVKDIRDRIGGGSNTTISDELLRWRKNDMPKLIGTGTPAPSHWSQAFVDMCDRLLMEARALERQLFEADRAQFQITVDGLQNEVLQLTRSRDEAFQLVTTESQGREAAEKLASTLQETLVHERAAAEQGRADREQLIDDLDKLQRQLEEALAAHAGELASLRQEHTYELDKLSASHALAMTTLREDTARREQLAYDRFEGARTQLMEETNRQREEFKAAQTDLEERLRRQEQEARAKEDQLRRNAALAERAESEARGELKALRHQLARAEADIDMLRKQPVATTPPDSTPSNLEAAREYCLKRLKEDVSAFDITAELQDEYGLILAEAESIVRECSAQLLNKGD